MTDDVAENIELAVVGEARDAVLVAARGEGGENYRYRGEAGIELGEVMIAMTLADLHRSTQDALQSAGRGVRLEIGAQTLLKAFERTHPGHEARTPLEQYLVALWVRCPPFSSRPATRLRTSWLERKRCGWRSILSAIIEGKGYYVLLRMRDRLKAVELLGRSHGMFSDKVQLEAGDSLEQILDRAERIWRSKQKGPDANQTSHR